MDDKNNFVQNEDLTLKTEKLTMKNKTDMSTSTNSGINIGMSSDIDAKSAVNSKLSGDIKYSDEGGFTIRRDKAVATLGKGKITVAGKDADPKRRKP